MRVKAHSRAFRFAHAKYGLVDGRVAINGSENFNTDSMPTTTNPPPGGRRGFYLITDAAPVVQALQHIFAADWAPDRFQDLRPYRADDEKYGDPPPDFVLPLPNLYTVRDAPFAQPLTLQTNARFEVISAPENAQRPDAGLHAKLAAAGAGDEIMFIQLYENKNWGATSSNPIADPNPRLLLLIDAARRGARVRLLLDSYFDEPEALRSNRATTDYLRALVAARTTGPTGAAGQSNRRRHPCQAGVDACGGGRVVGDRQPERRRGKLQAQSRGGRADRCLPGLRAAGRGL